MQRLVFRPSTGIASTLEALSILRHFEREYGREAFSLVQVFRVRILATRGKTYTEVAKSSGYVYFCRTAKPRGT